MIASESDSQPYQTSVVQVSYDGAARASAPVDYTNISSSHPVLEARS